MATVASSLLSAQVPLGVETFDAAWTTVRDSHFDKTMNGVNWDGVRAELRPRAEAARSDAELRAVVRDMLGRLGQSHFALIPSSVDAPADASRRVSAISAGTRASTCGSSGGICSSPASRAPGCRSSAQAGASSRWPAHRSSICCARFARGTRVPKRARLCRRRGNDRLLNVEAWRIAQTRLRGRPGSVVDVTFENGQGAPVRVSLERRPEQGQPVTVGSLPTMFVRVESERKQTPGGRTAGVIRFNVWMAAVDALFQKAVDRVPHRRRHRHRSSRKPRRARRHDDGDLRSLRR